MKKNYILIALAMLFLSLTSCNKQDIDGPKGGPFTLKIRGILDEFAGGTKSSTEPCIRMKWDMNDVAWAYDKNGTSLGKLTVTEIEDSNPYISTMTGTLSAAPADGRLFLVHSSLLSKDTQPAFTDNSLSIDLSSQEKNAIPFVAITMIDGVTEASQYETSGLQAKFGFATSILKVVATNVDENCMLKSTTLSNIETACKLTLHSQFGIMLIEGDNIGSISKPLPNQYEDDHQTEIYFGIPDIEYAENGRTLAIFTDGPTLYQHNFSGGYCDFNNVKEVVCDVRALNYIDEHGKNWGDGLYIASTGVVWAPVNCGYKPATDSGKGFVYGKLYQWGRKDGQGYDQTDESFPQKSDLVAGPIDDLSLVDDKKFYTANSYWYKTMDGGYLWIENGYTAYNPCPEGWRVPSNNELKALKGSSTKTKVVSGTHGSTTDILGVYLDGSDATTPSSGVFLPCGGSRDINGEASSRGTYGLYWSSSLKSGNQDDAYYLCVDDMYAAYGLAYRARGYHVRCVQK